MKPFSRSTRRRTPPSPPPHPIHHRAGEVRLDPPEGEGEAETLPPLPPAAEEVLQEARRSYLGTSSTPSAATIKIETTNIHTLFIIYKKQQYLLLLLLQPPWTSILFCPLANLWVASNKVSGTWSDDSPSTPVLSCPL